MSNWVEDYLISQLADEEAGIDAMRRNEMLHDDRGVRGLCLKLLEDAREHAEKTRGVPDAEGNKFQFGHPGITDLEIADEIGALGERLEIAEKNLRDFCAVFCGPSRLSRRRMRRLGSFDDNRDLKKSLEVLEHRVAELQREHSAAVEALRARRYLKGYLEDERELQRKVLHLRSSREVEKAMKTWRDLYPDRPSANGNVQQHA